MYTKFQCLIDTYISALILVWMRSATVEQITVLLGIAEGKEAAIMLRAVKLGN